MGALKTVGIVLLALIVIVGAAMVYFLTPTKTVAATLYIKQGTVEVKSNDGWSSA